MDRSALFALIDVAQGRGLEIGALDHPMITRDRGPVEYVDRASREALLDWYRGDHGVNRDAVVEVDHVWGEQSLLECAGGARVFDYVVASHVIEHVPDLFGWLEEIAAVLVDGGVAGFAVPDKRFTFDIDRRTSTTAELIDAYVRRIRRPDPRQVFDNFYNFRDPATGLNRNGDVIDDASQTADAVVLLDLCRRMLANGEYIDAHCWVFTPRSMREALDLASRLDLLPLEIALLTPTPPGSNEFLLALRRLPDGLSRAERREAFVTSCAQLDLPEEIEVQDPQATAAATAAAHHALTRAAAIESSTSWRITAPLRAAVDLARKLTARA